MSEHRFLVNTTPVKVRLPDLSNKTIFKAEVNDRSTVVELTEAVSTSKPFFIQVDGKPYHVELGKQKENGLTSVKVNGAPYMVQSEKRSPQETLRPSMLTVTVKRRPVKNLQLDKGVVAASMPGKVVLVRVKAGDNVKAGDVLLVLESMKMENEIVSPTRGFIREVRVSEGDAVNMGEEMVVIDEA